MSLHLAGLLIFTMGAFAFGALFLLWLRQYVPARLGGQAEPTTAGGLAPRLSFLDGFMNAVCVVWFVLNILWVLGHIGPGIRGDVVEIGIFLLTFLFPPLIMHCVWAGVRAERPRPPHPGWGWTVVAAYIVTQLTSLFLLLSMFRLIEVSQSRALFVSNVGFTLLFAGTGLYSVLILRRTDCPAAAKTSDERASRRWLLGLFGLLILLPLIILPGVLGKIPFFATIGLLLRSMPLMFLFVVTYYEDRFSFFDLFVKRGLFALLTLVLLTLTLAGLLPWLTALEVDWVRPWVFALVLLPVALALPWLYSLLARWLDNVWLGRRYTPLAALKHFVATLQSATSEADLVAQAQRGIAEIAQAPARIDLGLGDAPPPEFESALEVPIHGDGRRIGTLRLGRRRNRSPFFSEDVALLGSLTEVFSFMLENARLQRRKQEQEELARELTLHASRSELKALRAQINPHFLFNALNAIAGLIHKDPLRADRTVEQLAEVFRYTLRRSESEWAVLEDELEFVRAYLEVEQARFGKRLEVDVRADASVLSCRVPTMVVQTLVENAVKHGVAASRGVGRIEVDALSHAGRLRIAVSDNGPGFSGDEPAQAGGTGYGLRNVRERLAGHYGEAADLVIDRDDERGRTTVAVLLPLGRQPARRPDRASGGSGAV